MARSPMPRVRTSQFLSAPVSSATTPLIDIAGVAELLSIRPRYVQRLVSERRIPYVTVHSVHSVRSGRDAPLAGRNGESRRAPRRTGPDNQVL